MSDPIVSVLMPVHNGAKFLCEAVESVLGQTFADFEFLIIDDGSTDDSFEMLRRYQQEDSRVRVTRHQKSGLPKSLNALLALSRGQFLARMDCDDVAAGDRLAVQVHALRADTSLVCVGGNFDLIDERGRLLTTLQTPPDHATIEQRALAGHGSICHPTAVIRADTMRAVHGYDETFEFAEDLDLWLRLAEVGRLGNVQRTILKYRLHSKSVSETYGREQRRFAKLACERAWARRGIQGTFEADEPWRPGHDAESRAKYAVRYGWWAFNHGTRATALHYAVRAIRAGPFKAAAWRLLLCAALKPLPKVR